MARAGLDKKIQYGVLLCLPLPEEFDFLSKFWDILREGDGGHFGWLGEDRDRLSELSRDSLSSTANFGGGKRMWEPRRKLILQTVQFPH